MKDRWKGPGGTLVSMREAMRRIGASHVTVHRLITLGELEDFRYTDGGWHWIYEDSLLKYLGRRGRKNRATRPSKKRSKR